MATFDRRAGKDGRYVYRARVRRKGHSQQVATFHKLADARKWAQIIEAGMLEGQFKSTEAKFHTLADLIDHYIEEVLPRKSQSSINMQTQQLKWWQVHLGFHPLADITPALIAEHRDILSRSRANSTVNRYLAALSHALTFSVKELGWLDESPMRKVSKPKEPRGRVRFLSENERASLLDACKDSTSKYLYIVVVLALSTGARKMELLSLTWRDVDLQRAIIYIQDSKNGDCRTLPLTGYALQLMRQHVTAQRIDTPLLFPGPRTGTKPLSIRTAWLSAVKRAGIENFTFHDLRHSAASYMLMSGATLGEIGEILGHRNYETTRKYVHQSESHTRGVVERMNEKIFDKLT